MHRNSPWMLGEEEGLSGDLTSRSSGWRSDECGHATRSGGNDDLSSGESGCLHKRKPKEGREWMRWRIVRLLALFIGRRREGRWCHGEKMVGASGVIQ
jgi:hypothetical protein